MDRSDVMNLISVTYTQDAIKQQVKTETPRQVYCHIGSVTLNEFFAAGSEGIRPECQVKMFKYDYQNEKIAEINNKRYYVYRVYEGKNDIIELYLGEREGI